MRLYKAEFDPMYPVPSGLIILAEDEGQAWKIAKETVKHTEVKALEEISMQSGVVYYESGDY